MPCGLGKEGEANPKKGRLSLSLLSGNTRVMKRMGELLLRIPFGPMLGNWDLDLWFHGNLSLIKGVRILNCCGARKVREDSVCFLTSSEPEKISISSNGNNLEVVI